MRRLSAPDGPLAQQNKVLSEHIDKMEIMFTMLLSLTGNMQHVTQGVKDVPTVHTLTAPPSSTTRERDTSTGTCQSPVRRKQKTGPNDVQME
jgi:hypothetical protein